MAYVDLTPSDGELAAIRVLIPDTDAVFGSTGDQYLFTDDQLTSYYSVSHGLVLRAAAYACLAIGSSEAMIAKKITTADLSTDGTDIAGAFLKNAALLFARADHDELQQTNDTFVVVDYKTGWPYWNYLRGNGELQEPLYPFGGDPSYPGF